MSLEAYKVAVKLSLVDEFSGAMGLLMSRLSRAGVEATALQSKLHSIGKTMTTGLMATGAGLGIAYALNASTKEAVKLEQQINRLKALNLGDSANSQLMDAAERISKTTKGTTQYEAMKLVTESQAITGHVSHTLELAPLLAKMRFGIETYMSNNGKGDGHGSGAEKQFADIVKVMEMRGLMRDFNHEKLDRMADLFTKSFVASGGQVKPSDFLNMMKTGGVAAKSVNEDFMFALGHIMQEKGGSRSGTQIMSGYQSLVMGRTTQQVAENLLKVGLLDKSHVHYGKTGHITKLDPGALTAVETMIANPQDYMNKYVMPALIARGVNTSDQNATLMAISKLSSNRMAADMLAGLYMENGQITNYVKQSKNAKGVDAMYKQAEDSTVGKRLDMHAKLNNLQVQFGKAALPIVIHALEIATPLLEKFGRLLERNPALLKAVIFGLVALAGSLLISGPLLLLSGVFRVLGVAGTVLAAIFPGITAALSTTVSGGLGFALTALASPIGIAIAAIGLLAATLYAFRPISQAEVDEVNKERGGGVQLSASSKARIAAGELERFKTKGFLPPKKPNSVNATFQLNADAKKMGLTITQVQTTSAERGIRNGGSVYDPRIGAAALGFN